jgi:hypothetical protein
MDAWLERRRAQVRREDLFTFVSAAAACTGQREFYSDARGQTVSLAFLHQYMLGTERRLYAGALALSLNHFNQLLVIENLLSAPRGAGPWEGRLIAAALRRLPPQRVYRLLERLRKRRINNRRTRAVIRDYLAGRADLVHDAVKYRRRVRIAARHAHVSLPGETGRFLFALRSTPYFSAPMFRAFRRAHYDRSALSELPYTVAVGLAARRKMNREALLSVARPRLTREEALRLQVAEAEPLELGSVPLTRLASYILALPVARRLARSDELREALARSAGRAARDGRSRLPRVAAVLDRSWSSSGSREKHLRPLAVSLATSALLAAASTEYRAFWTASIEDELLVTPHGQTDLVTPTLAALAWQPSILVLVSDGYENDPAGGFAELVRMHDRYLDPEGRLAWVHFNPVFDPDSFVPRPVSPLVPTVGLRDAADIPPLLSFIRALVGGCAMSGPLELTGLTAAPAQILGSFRLVPLLREPGASRLRLDYRPIGETITAARLNTRGLHYLSHIPYALSLTTDTERPRDRHEPDGKIHTYHCASVRIAQRMVKKQGPGEIRLFPLHLAMEGYLSICFGGPDISWAEYSRRALTTGLNPRCEFTVPGSALPGFDAALATFEIHENQCGVMVFVAEALASILVVGHPDDYRLLHPALLADFYGELIYRYGFMYPTIAVQSHRVDGGPLTDLADLARALTSLKAAAREETALLTQQIMTRDIAVEHVTGLGACRIERFMTDLMPDLENHIGERILHDDGSLQYLKTYRLSAGQTRRAHLLSRLKAASWNLDEAAAALHTSKDALIIRLDAAGFGYLLKEDILFGARRRMGIGRPAI